MKLTYLFCSNVVINFINRKRITSGYVIGKYISPVLLICWMAHFIVIAKTLIMRVSHGLLIIIKNHIFSKFLDNEICIDILKRQLTGGHIFV